MTLGLEFPTQRTQKMKPKQGFKSSPGLKSRPLDPNHASAAARPSSVCLPKALVPASGQTLRDCTFVLSPLVWV